ncbi:heme peroxidase family protein [Streptomyces roseoverticillatus]|uniref:peroxidase family protein n=1 Tax=Streptomyces roseoverticillatus TaxID=66429 RepID=UPI003401EE59
MHRHHRNSYYLVNEGRIIEGGADRAVARVPTPAEEQQAYRFSRLSKEKGVQIGTELRIKLALAMTEAQTPDPESQVPVPAGFTYLGQFVDHDLTLDNTQVDLGDLVSVEDLVQARSPALDLDSVYGLGPHHVSSVHFYEPDGRLKTGTTAAAPFPPGFPTVNTDQKGFDLARAGSAAGGTKADQRAALIPDARNDENLVVASVHRAFIAFHNRVHEQLAEGGLFGPKLFHAARDSVVRHYQWMLRTDFLPRIVDPDIVERVFTHGRRHFEVPGGRHEERPTMPIEFSVAAYRFGHSMIRDTYQWNRVFRVAGPGGPATLGLLFRFSGTSGNLNPASVSDSSSLFDLDDPNAGGGLTLPSNWIADYRRFFDFGEAGRHDLTVPAGEFNPAKRIDTLLVDPLATLPEGAFAGRGHPAPPAIQRNLAFRNLTRAAMVELATGPQLAAQLGIMPLTADQILHGDNGASLASLTDEECAELVAHTPLWFYILREAEVNKSRPGRLTGVGGTLVAEVFHRAMESSLSSIVRDRDWRPTLPAYRPGTFTMADLLLFAFDGDADRINPLGDGPLATS